ncbi:hypothetical protein [Alteromonas sp. P256]|uniref:hypothetical protein n=1 Tax=Alteromonas sp. P256 TaxID=3117399 RepID=UPI002FDF34F7
MLAVVFSSAASAGLVYMDFSDKTQLNSFQTRGESIGLRLKANRLEIILNSPRNRGQTKLDLANYISLMVDFDSSLILDEFSFRARRGSAGREGSLFIRSSLDGFTTNIYENYIHLENRDNPIQKIGLSELFTTKTNQVEFRLYITDPAERHGLQTRIHLDDLTITTVTSRHFDSVADNRIIRAVSAPLSSIFAFAGLLVTLVISKRHSKNKFIRKAKLDSL